MVLMFQYLIILFLIITIFFTIISIFFIIDALYKEYKNNISSLFIDYLIKFITCLSLLTAILIFIFNNISYLTKENLFNFLIFMIIIVFYTLILFILYKFSKFVISLFKKNIFYKRNHNQSAKDQT